MARLSNLVERISRWDPEAVPLALRWGLAAGGFVLAFVLRQELDGLLPVGYPYLTFLPVILVGAYFLGAGPASLIAGASLLAAWYYFLPPVRTFTLTGPTLLAQIFFAFIAIAGILMIALAQRARRQLDAERRANAVLAEQRRLMFHELQHRVSNNLASVSGLLKLQRRLVSDEAAGLALEDSVRRIDLVARIMRNLHDPDGQSVDMGRFLADTGRDILESAGTTDRVSLTVEAISLLVGPDVSVPLGLIASELVANTLEHGFPGASRGQIDVSLALASEPDRAALRIRDNGQGLPEDFDIETTRSLGLSIARQFAIQLGGTLVMERRPKGGTEARLEFSY